MRTNFIFNGTLILMNLAFFGVSQALEYLRPAPPTYSLPPIPAREARYFRVKRTGLHQFRRARICPRYTQLLEARVHTVISGNVAFEGRASTRQIESYAAEHLMKNALQEIFSSDASIPILLDNICQEVNSREQKNIDFWGRLGRAILRTVKPPANLYVLDHGHLDRGFWTHLFDKVKEKHTVDVVYRVDCSGYFGEPPVTKVWQMDEPSC